MYKLCFDVLLFLSVECCKSYGVTWLKRSKVELLPQRAQRQRSYDSVLSAHSPLALHSFRNCSFRASSASVLLPCWRGDRDPPLLQRGDLFLVGTEFCWCCHILLSAFSFSTSTFTPLALCNLRAVSSTLRGLTPSDMAGLFATDSIMFSHNKQILTFQQRSGNNGCHVWHTWEEADSTSQTHLSQTCLIRFVLF